jgi:Holliday junction resolvase
MRFVGGSERTPFAVAAGRDRTDPRISSVRVREGRASRGNPAPYLLEIAGTDSGTGTVAIEVRVGYEKPLRFAAGDEIEIGPFMKSTGGKVVLLMRGVTVEVRLIDAAGNESSWRRVRLP